MRTSYLLPLLALFPLTACGSDAAPADDHAGHDHAAAGADATATLAEGEFHVECGCAIPSVGHCAEFVEVDGAMVPLTLPEGHTLGGMPFCGKEGLVAELDGDVVDGTFVAERITIKE